MVLLVHLIVECTTLFEKIAGVHDESEIWLGKTCE